MKSEQMKPERYVKETQISHLGANLSVHLSPTGTVKAHTAMLGVIQSTDNDNLLPSNSYIPNSEQLLGSHFLSVIEPRPSPPTTMTSDEFDDVRIWRWWTLPCVSLVIVNTMYTDFPRVIIAKSSEMIELQSQGECDDEIFRATVHKELLCFYSTYYTAAIKGRFAEAEQDKFVLELNCEQTRFFVTWLYSGRLEHHPDNGLDSEDAYALYTFADQTNIIALRRTIMSFLIDSTLRWLREHHFPGDLEKVIPRFPDQSQLRRFLLEEATTIWIDDSRLHSQGIENFIVHDQVPDGYPRDFFVQLFEGYCLGMEKKKKDGGKRTADHTCYDFPCEHHEHSHKREWQTCKQDDRFF